MKSPNSDSFRPILFEDVEFPPSLMAISVLTSVLVLDDDVTDWVLHLAACRGVIRHAPADDCRDYASRAIDAIFDHRAQVLETISEALGPYGFESESTLHDWLKALAAIMELAQAADTICTWTSSSLPGEEGRAQENARRFDRFLDSLDDQGEK